MTIYTTVLSQDGARVAKIHDGGCEYFTGYDFMGSAEWTGPDGYGALVMGLEEAEQIADDLTAAE